MDTLQQSKTVRVAFYSTKIYEKELFDQHCPEDKVSFTYYEASLNAQTALFTKGFYAVCVFVNDKVGKQVIDALHKNGVQLIVLRCAGFNNVEVAYANEKGIKVLHVPAYSPHAVAEHTLALIMALNRKTHKAFNRIREANFALDGLLGFDVHGTTVGVIGTGKIGMTFCRIMLGMGCEVLAYDPSPSESLSDSGVKYVDLENIYRKSDIISLHCPLNPNTHHLINDASLSQMKDGVMLINTSRGGLIDTKSIIKGLKSKKIGYLGLDVYEQEEHIFFKDLSDQIIDDDVIMRLITFPNVLVTAHQAFFTENAMGNIVMTTIENIVNYFEGHSNFNEVRM